MPTENIQGVAGGDIRTCRFIKLSTAADHRLLEADANEQTIGISSQAAQDAPIPGASANAAESGDSFRYHTEGEVALLEIGSGGVTRGAQIKSDADGKGVLAATTGTTTQWVGAMALESAAEGEKCRVLIKSFPIRPAIA